MKRLKKTLVVFMALCMMFSQWTFVQAADKIASKYVITMDKKVYTMKKGKTVVLKPTLNKAARNKKVEWSSSKKNIATVSSKGKVTAKKNGKTTITARIKGTSAKVDCKLTVGTPVEKIKLMKSSIAVKVGGYYKVKVTVLPKKPTNKKVTYKSSNVTVATVTPSGVVKALKEGNAKITVTAADGTGKKATYKVKVESKEVKNPGDDSEDSNNNTPNTEKPSTEKPSTEKPNTETPSTGTASTEKPSTDKPNTETPSTEKPDIETPSTEKPGTETPNTETPNTETPSTEEPSTEKPSTETPSTEEPSTEEPSTETPSTEVEAKSVKLSESSLALKVGENKKLTASIEPSNADNKKITWTTSDAEVVSVDTSGNVEALKEGKANVTASTANGKQASCQVTVSQAELEEQSRNVATQEELNEALLVDDVEKIVYKSNTADTITVPKGDYTDKTLEINAPNGDVTNNGKFTKVVVHAIANDTYVENAENTIEFQAAQGRIVVGSEGTATINMSGSKEGHLRLENNGTVRGLNVSTQSVLEIQGKNSVPVTLEAGAAGTEVDTSVKLNVNASASNWDMTVLPGGEQTKVTVNNRDAIPSVDGVGCIPVTVRSENTRVNVQARTIDDERINQSVSVSGIVQEYVKSGSDYNLRESAGADIYLVAYTADNISRFDEAEENAGLPINSVPDAKTDSTGNYKIQNVKIGSYWMLVKKDNFETTVKIISITSDNGNSYSNGSISLLQRDDVVGASDISGKIINGLTGKDLATDGIQVELRKGNGNIVGEAYKKTVTDSKGRYSFTAVPFGAYTVHVVDLRENLPEGSDMFNPATIDIVVASNLVKDNYNIVLNPKMGDVSGIDQVQFTLTWGTEESGASSDIDSHLWGPDPDGSEFHVWFNDESHTYLDEKMADLDVDDITFEGPEHTTIYKEVDGVYRFYIHNYLEGNSITGDMSMLAKSSIQVRVTMGEDTYTYDCPSEEGNLWYVCDYDSATRQIIKKDIVSAYSGDVHNIGAIQN